MVVGLIRKVASLQNGRQYLEDRFGPKEIDAVTLVHLYKAAAAEDKQLLKIAAFLPGNTISAYEALGGTFKKEARDMPSFTSQDRPKKVKEIYSAIKREHPGMPAEMKARIAARQGKKGKQHQGPPYKGPLTKQAIGAPMFSVNGGPAPAAPKAVVPQMGAQPGAQGQTAMSGTAGGGIPQIKEPKIPGQNIVQAQKTSAALTPLQLRQRFAEQYHWAVPEGKHGPYGSTKEVMEEAKARIQQQLAERQAAVEKAEQHPIMHRFRGAGAGALVGGALGTIAGSMLGRSIPGVLMPVAGGTLIGAGLGAVAQGSPATVRAAHQKEQEAWKMMTPQQQRLAAEHAIMNKMREWQEYQDLMGEQRLHRRAVEVAKAGRPVTKQTVVVPQAPAQAPAQTQEKTSAQKPNKKEKQSAFSAQEISMAQQAFPPPQPATPYNPVGQG